MGRKPNHIMRMDVLHGTDWLSREWNHPASNIGDFNKRTGKVKPVKETQDVVAVDVIGSRRQLQGIRRYEASCSGCTVGEIASIDRIRTRKSKKKGKK